jgi:hypothetical protein
MPFKEGFVGSIMVKAINAQGRLFEDSMKQI